MGRAAQDGAWNGQRHGNAKRADQEVLKIRALFRTGMPVSEISATFDVPERSIYYLVNEGWGHLELSENSVEVVAENKRSVTKPKTNSDREKERDMSKVIDLDTEDRGSILTDAEEYKIKQEFVVDIEPELIGVARVCLWTISEGYKANGKEFPDTLMEAFLFLELLEKAVRIQRFDVIMKDVDPEGKVDKILKRALRDFKKRSYS